MSGVLAPAPPAGLDPSPSRPTFSIVISAYQAAATVADAVRSALAQTYPAHEIVVVDDGSTDDLAGALHAFTESIVLVRKENGGGASALNAGTRAATGEFIAILDSDDTYHPRRLEVLARLAQDRPDLDLITTDARFVVDGRAVGRFSASTPFEVTDQRRAIFRSCFVGGWPAVRLARIHAVGGFDESFRIGYDWDCWLRLILDGCRAGLVDAPYYDYSLHPGSLSASRSASLWERVRLLEKAAHSPALDPEEHPELLRQLRVHRSRAILADTRRALESGSGRLALWRFAVSRQVALRVRVAAVLAAAAPSLARRIVPPDIPPEERFRDVEPEAGAPADSQVTSYDRADPRP